MQTRALYTLGALAVVDWDQLEAMTTLTECLPRCYELGDMTLTADCEVDLASAYMIQGDTCAAALHAERALTTASETGDPWTEAWVLATTADCTVRQDLARDRGERALALSCSLGDRLLSAHIKANLGYGAVVAGDYDYARLISEQAISEGHGIWGASRKAQLEANLGSSLCSKASRRAPAGTSGDRWRTRNASDGGQPRTRTCLASPHSRPARPGTIRPGASPPLRKPCTTTRPKTHSTRDSTTSSPESRATRSTSRH